MELDAAQVAAFVGDRLGCDIEAVERIRHGEWSTAFSFRTRSATGTAEYVVRFGATDDDFHKDRRAMAHTSAELPIPKIVEIGQALPNFEERMRCYELAIGVDGLAYQAWAGHLTNLQWTTQRVLALL